MRALGMFPQQRAVRVFELAEPPTPGPHQVLLRPREVGICGTDREIAAFEYGVPPPGADHLVLGHEALAEIVGIGDEVQQLHPGQLVVPIVRRPCEVPACRPCRAGRQDFCVTEGFRERGIKESDGFLAELTLDHEDAVITVPAGLASVGVLIEPLTVVAKAIAQAHKLKDRLPWEPVFQRALVLGAGPVGLLAAMGALVNHYQTTVYSREPSDGERASFVRGFGADYLSSVEVALPELAERLAPIDLICEATGFSPLAFGSIEVLGPNGMAVFTGVPGHHPPRSMDTDLLMRRLVLRNQIAVRDSECGTGGLHRGHPYAGVVPGAIPRQREGAHHRPLPAGPRASAAVAIQRDQERGELRGGLGPELSRAPAPDDQPG